MSGEDALLNVLALVKGNERYVFIYDDTTESETQLLRTLGRFANDKQLSFSWYDCAVLSRRVREAAEDRKAARPEPRF